LTQGCIAAAHESFRRIATEGWRQCALHLTRGLLSLTLHYITRVCTSKRHFDGFSGFAGITDVPNSYTGTETGHGMSDVCMQFGQKAESANIYAHTASAYSPLLRCLYRIGSVAVLAEHLKTKHVLSNCPIHTVDATRLWVVSSAVMYIVIRLAACVGVDVVSLTLKRKLQSQSAITASAQIRIR